MRDRNFMDERGAVLRQLERQGWSTSQSNARAAFRQRHSITMADFGNLAAARLVTYPEMLASSGQRFYKVELVDGLENVTEAIEAAHTLIRLRRDKRPYAEIEGVKFYFDDIEYAPR